MAPKPIEIVVKTVGIDGVQRDLSDLGGHGKAAAAESARGAEGLASVLFHVTETGKLSARTTKELVTGLGEVAGFVGSTGLIIGGVALLGAAFVEAFAKADESMKKAHETMQQLNDQSVRLHAELTGNVLGQKELQIADKYNAEFKKIDEQFSNSWFGKLLIAGGFGAFAKPEEFLKPARDQLAKATYGDTDSEISKAKRDEALRKGIADAGALGQGFDPVQRYSEQLKAIELQREKAIESGELSEEAANHRAAAQKETLVRNAYEYEQTLATEVAVAQAKFRENVFAAQKIQEDSRYEKELRDLGKLTLTEQERVAAVDQIKLKHTAIGLEIEKQRQYALEASRIEAGKGDINPLVNLRAELDAIELKRKKSIDAGADEVAATETAENEKRQIFQNSIDAAIRSNDSLAKIATKVALDPLISYLEGLAIQEAIKAEAHYADFDIVGGTLHAAAATAALAGAHEIAQLAGGSASGGGSHASGSGGGVSAASLSSATGGSGGRTTVVIKGGQLLNMRDPETRAQFIAAIKTISNDGEIDFILQG